MFRSVKKAEEAALNGEGREEFDTQACQLLQLDVLSVRTCSPPSKFARIALTHCQSSPRIAPDDDNSGNQDASQLDHTIAGEIPPHIISESHAREEGLEINARDDDNLEQQSSALIPEIERVDNALVPRKKPIVFRRDSHGRMRAFNTEGQEYHRRIPEFEQRVEALKDEQRVNMDDSQRSTLTPTQANSDSLYAQYDIQNVIREQKPSNSLDVDSDESEDEHAVGRESVIIKQHHSAITDSTAHTYGENDTGHVNFDFLQQPETQNHEMDGNSQDTSFAPRMQDLPRNRSFEHEPQTPAPPINPFSQKGSVLKGHEMFGATQPSSIGRHMASPTSSRPSPDVYHKNSSPHKRITTSPLIGRGDDTVLQSSVRTMLQSEPIETPTRPEPLRARSFDRRREPKATYTSSAQSQERREREAARASSQNSDSDEDSDPEPMLKNRRKERERMAKIERQLAQVTSSRPGSGNSGEVEVPSTGRRRHSIQEEYLRKSGAEGGDSQQIEQEVITDSQSLVEEPEEMDLPDTVASSAQLVASGPKIDESREPIDHASPRSSLKLPPRASSIEPQRVPDLYPNPQSEEISSLPKDPGSPLQQPSLPLREVSTNRNDLRTPMPNKTQVMSDGADTTIPNTILETSPLGEDRIRPMGEIASLSFADNTYDAMIDDVPGFTQDVEFENAIKPRSSSTPPPRTRTRDKDFPSFEQLAAAGPSSISEEPRVPKSTAVAGAAGDATALSAFVESQKDHSTGNNGHGRLDKPKEQAKATAEGPTENAAEDGSNREDGEISDLQGMQADAPVNAVDEPGQQDENGNETRDDEVIEAPQNNDAELDKPQKQPKVVSKAVRKLAKPPTAKIGGLRTKDELKGPSKALRRSKATTPTISAQRASSRVTKVSSAAKTASTRSSKRITDASSTLSTPLSSLRSTPGSSARPSTRNKATIAARLDEAAPVLPAKALIQTSMTQARPAKETPVPAQLRTSRCSTFQAEAADTPASDLQKRSSKRKPAVISLDGDEPTVTRSSKRQSIAQGTRESSNDPIALPTTALNATCRARKSTGLFHNMAFAVSYVKQDKEKSQVSDLINQQGGRILEQGFDALFETAPLSGSKTQVGDEEAELVLSATTKSLGFAALIADEHSRKAKYMQALALSLPCISGRWISTCVAKGEVVDWTPYLLCAGQSLFLGNAIRSRTLTPYSATDATFSETFASREKLLDGKSVLLVTGKGQAEDKRKAYVFLTRVLGPARLCQVVDIESARKKLSEDDSWDLLYVDKNETAAEAAVFRSTAQTSGGSKKRKRGPTAADESTEPVPKRVRVISDEAVIQSLILGQFLDD